LRARPRRFKWFPSGAWAAKWRSQAGVWNESRDVILNSAILRLFTLRRSVQKDNLNNAALAQLDKNPSRVLSYFSYVGESYKSGDDCDNCQKNANYERSNAGAGDGGDGDYHGAAKSH
jgi:hypothetical protein